MFRVNRNSEKVETQLIETNTYYYWEFAAFIGIALKKTQHIASQFQYTMNFDSPHTSTLSCMT